MEWPKSVIFSTRDMVEKRFPGADANGTRNQREKQDSVCKNYFRCFWSSKESILENISYVNFCGLNF